MCDLPKNFLEAATKEILGIWKKTCVDKVISAVQLLVQSDEKTAIAAVKILSLT